MEIEEVREIEGERYLAPKVAAAEFGFTKDQIGQMARLGSVEAKLIGRVWYIRERDLIERRAREEAQRKAEEATQRAEEEARRQAREHREVDSEPVPEVMTFARRLAQTKPMSKTNRSVVHDNQQTKSTLNDQEIDGGDESPPSDNPRRHTEGAHDAPQEEAYEMSASRSVRMRAKNSIMSERVRDEREHRDARLLGSMDIRYEQRPPLSYDYDPVLPPLTKEGVALERKARIIPTQKSEKAAPPRPARSQERSRMLDTRTDRPALDSVKKKSAHHASIRVTETSRPSRAPDVALQRSRKKKKGKRILKKRRVRRLILTWCIIGMIGMIALYATVVFVEGVW